VRKADIKHYGPEHWAKPGFSSEWIKRDMSPETAVEIAIERRRILAKKGISFRRD